MQENLLKQRQITSVSITLSACLTGTIIPFSVNWHTRRFFSKILPFCPNTINIYISATHPHPSSKALYFPDIQLLACIFPLTRKHLVCPAFNSSYIFIISVHQRSQKNKANIFSNTKVHFMIINPFRDQHITNDLSTLQIRTTLCIQITNK